MQSFKSYLIEEGETWRALKHAIAIGVKEYKKAIKPKPVNEKKSRLDAIIAAKTPTDFAAIAEKLRLQGQGPKDIDHPQNWLLDHVQSQKWNYYSKDYEKRSSYLIEVEARKLVGNPYLSITQ